MGKRFDLTKYGNTVSIKSFELEELVGRDSMDAAARSMPPAPSDGSAPAPIHPGQFGIMHRNQKIMQAISKVNDQAVIRPHMEFQDWTLRTQAFVCLAFDRMNDVTKEEENDFLVLHFGPQAVSPAASNAT